MAGLLWTSDQLVAEAATCTTRNRHNRRTYMSSERFEDAIQGTERLQTCVLDRTATGIHRADIYIQSFTVAQRKVTFSSLLP
jgi:hypothetical protein